MHKVFISYHHGNDQYYKEYLVKMAREHRIFVDMSVDTGDINENLPDSRIREIIRDDYLRNSTVTIVLVGSETARRKHVDWEIYSSMFDGIRNKKSGILAITLPSCTTRLGYVTHVGEKNKIYPGVARCVPIRSRTEMKRRYPEMPDRIIDNLVNSKADAKISIVPWTQICNDPGKLRWLVEATFRDRTTCKYDLSTQMRRANS